MQKMQPRIQAASSRLQSELSSAMRVALAGDNATALGICLHGYSALGVPQAAEQVHWFGARVRCFYPGERSGSEDRLSAVPPPLALPATLNK